MSNTKTVRSFEELRETLEERIGKLNSLKRMTDGNFQTGTQLAMKIYRDILSLLPASQPKQEEELTDDELYESIYMDVVRLVEKDNIQCEEYSETMKKLMAQYVIKKRILGESIARGLNQNK